LIWPHVVIHEAHYAPPIGKKDVLLSR
jgi:hypothetical protein